MNARMKYEKLEKVGEGEFPIFVLTLVEIKK